MLHDVIHAIRDAGLDPQILSTETLPEAPADVIVDERELSTAVNAQLEPPVAVVMADLALLRPVALHRVLEQPGDLVIGPGRGGGTNVLLVRSEGFRTDFHGTSLADHRRKAEQAGLTVEEIDSFRLATDIDEPDDLVEVLLHGSGDAPQWLREHGFQVVETDGRVAITRE